MLKITSQHAMLTTIALAFVRRAGADLQLVQTSMLRSANGGSAEPAERTATLAPAYLEVAWPCSDPGIGDSTFTLQGSSATGAPIYSNDDGNYLYWDASCDGA